MLARKLMIVALALAVCLPMAAAAGPPGGGPGGFGGGGFGPGADGPAGHGPGILPPADFLGLTADQIAAVEVLREEFRVDLQPLHEERMALAETFRAELEKEAPDATTVGQLVLDQRAVGDRMQDVLTAFLDDFVALLDEEQVALYEAWREVRGTHRDHGGRGRGGRGHGGPGGHGPGGPGSGG